MNLTDIKDLQEIMPSQQTQNSPSIGQLKLFSIFVFFSLQEKKKKKPSNQLVIA